MNSMKEINLLEKESLLKRCESLMEIFFYNSFTYM